MVIHRVIVLTSVGWLLLSLPAAAQTSQPPLADKSIEELMAIEVASVVGAAKHEQRVTEAPSSVTIVTAADIRTFGWRTLGDVLRSVRGFYVTYDRNYTYLGVRGFGRPTDYNNRVLVMVDGHRLNDNIFDAAPLGSEGVVDLDLVDRIEIIRGPGSALYGTSAFFAVVNVITRRGGALGGVEAATEAGLESHFSGRASAGWDWGTNGELLMSASHLRYGGGGTLYFPEYDTPVTHNGRVTGLDGDEATSLLANARVGEIKIQGAYSTRTKSVPTAAWGVEFGRASETTDTRGWLDATYDRAFGKTTVASRAYVDHVGYHGAYPYNAEIENRDSADGLWIGGDLSASRRLGTRHRVTAGFEQRFNLRQQQKNWDEPSQAVYVDDDHTSQQSAVYVQDEITLSRRLTATLGARWDYWSLAPSSLRPRAGLVYRTERDMALKFLYGEAFRAANMYELFYAEANSEPNPTLSPERLQTSEVVFEQYLAGRFRLTAGGFFTHIDDLIDQGNQARVVHVNRQSAGACGVEGEIEYRSTGGILARGSVVVQRVGDRVTDEPLSNAPEHMATLQFALPLGSRDVTLGYDSSFVGERLTRNRRPLDAYWLANLVTTWQPRHTSLVLQGAINNIFNSRYEHPVGDELLQDALTQDGRSASIKVSVRF